MRINNGALSINTNFIYNDLPLKVFLKIKFNHSSGNAFIHFHGIFDLSLFAPFMVLTFMYY